MAANWTAAVEATATSATTGKAIVYSDQPIAAFYFSSSGGRTHNSEDVWGGILLWARSVDDHWSLDARYNSSGDAAWSYTRSQAQVASAFGMPGVARIAVDACYVSGALKKE